MLRISKLTDYSIILMAYIAKNSDTTHKASLLATETGIAGPTVAKLLKKLAKSKLLISSRGVTGGYKLSSPATEISISDIVSAIEGPLGITTCSLQENLCHVAKICDVKKPWMKINQTIMETLANYKLNDFINYTSQELELETKQELKLEIKNDIS